MGGGLSMSDKNLPEGLVDPSELSCSRYHDWSSYIQNIGA